MIQEKYGFRGYMDIKNTEKRNGPSDVNNFFNLTSIMYFILVNVFLKFSLCPEILVRLRQMLCDLY